jgi:hypothetical protein
MLNWVDCNLHKDDMFAFKSIKAHRLHPDPMSEKKMGLDKAAKGSYQLLVNPASGETSWVNYKIIFQDDPMSVALYGKGTDCSALQGSRISSYSSVTPKRWLE